MKNREASSDKLTVIPRNKHAISRKSISDSALKVLYRLSKSGHRACLVGGGVRDLLLGIQPKDFDVATDATPEEWAASGTDRQDAPEEGVRELERSLQVAHQRDGGHGGDPEPPAYVALALAIGDVAEPSLAITDPSPPMTSM